jgi:Rieske Fe-S protein
MALTHRGGDGGAGAGGGSGPGAGGQGGPSGGGEDAGAASGSGGAAGGSAAAGGGEGGRGGGGGNAGAAGSAGANGPPPSDGGSPDAAGAPLCSGPTVVGKATGLIVGSLVSLGYGVVVGRDAGGLYAMSSICTHQGCGMNIVGAVGKSSLHCPCHGSNFSATGAVTGGPARVPLQHFKLLVSASGDLAVCSDVVVPSGQRTPV